MDMWTFRLWAFSKRFPHWSQANSSSASALCLVMWYLRDARCLHWKPQISHLEGKTLYEQQYKGPKCCRWGLSHVGKQILPACLPEEQKLN